jgi:hypothetical protein
MKKIILIIISSLAFQFTSNAQYKKRSLEDRSAFFTKEIVDYIPSLNKTQQEQLLQINITTTAAFDSLKALKLESEDYKPAARAIFVQRDASVKKILTPFQYDEYLMLQAEKKQQSIKKKEAEKKGKEEKEGKVKEEKVLVPVVDSAGGSVVIPEPALKKSKRKNRK